ncbi:MAG: PilZ domain-containing protein [Bdellovibrionota bacterium]
MAIPQKKERRLSNRKKLTGLLPGRLTDKTGQDIACRPVDVSQHGLGIVANSEYDAGDRFQLVTKEHTVELEVVWVQTDFGKKDLFRHGLATIDQETDLEELFLKSGCLI